MVYGLVLSFGGVCSSRCLRGGGAKKFRPLIDTLVSAKSSCGDFSCYYAQFLRNSSNCSGFSEAVMATSGSVVPSGDLFVDTLVSGCGNLSGFVKPGVFFRGSCRQICGWGRGNMRNGEAKSLHYLHGCLQSDDSRFNGISSLFPASNQQIPSFSCYSDRAAASESSTDKSLSVDQITSLAFSVEEKNLKESPMKLESGAFYLPHPNKVKTGGEDAFFLCQDESAIGVADGVGGWADVGVDAGMYARELMGNSVEVLRELLPIDLDLLNVLEKAHARTKALGSSTACIIVLKNQDVNAINLGDSGFIIIRDGRTVFQSPAQQHGFNFPYQLEGSNMGDPPSSAQVFKIPIKTGDAIVVGTDGLFDNLYSREMETIVAKAIKEGLSPKATAEKIGAAARSQALGTKNVTPFAAAAQQAGFSYFGGKLDDLTVVVSFVVAASEDP